jgi:small ligand-binding sensory domain FIST
MTRIGAGISTAVGTGDACREAALAAREGLGGDPADLVLVFLSPYHLASVTEAAQAVGEVLTPQHLAGCVAQGVIGQEREVESGRAIAVWAASFPVGTVVPFHAAAVEDGEDIAFDGVPDLLDADLLVLLADPFALPVGTLLQHLADLYPALPVVGGLATGAGQPGTQALLLNGDLFESGAIGLALSGMPIKAIVSQGCAPLGTEAVITRAEGNVIFELAGKPALERLRDTIASLSPAERQRAGNGLMVGLVIDENKPEYGRGDYLMRGILGADDESGAIAIGEQVRVGQTLRFHARDAASADADLRLAVGETLTAPGTQAVGALLFACNGRGTNMFSEPHHDARVLADALGTPALAGFFCGGEVGPVGGRSFIHGFTATIAAFF